MLHKFDTFKQKKFFIISGLVIWFMIIDRLHFCERECERESKNLGRVNANVIANARFQSERERERERRFRSERERERERERGKSVIH